MLKLLLKLWADQKRRDFKWGRFLGEAYFFVLFMNFMFFLLYRDSLKGRGRLLPFSSFCTALFSLSGDCQLQDICSLSTEKSGVIATRLKKKDYLCTKKRKVYGTTSVENYSRV